MSEWDDPKNNGLFFPATPGPERTFKILKGIFAGKTGLFVRQDGDYITLMLAGTADKYKISDVEEV